MSQFKDNVLKNLGKYKKDVLNIHEKGIFNYKGEKIYYDHILPKNKKNQNIIKDIRNSFWSSNYSKINFHRYFHHLNSSQGLCINFFYPLIFSNQIKQLYNFLNIDFSNNIKSEFESESKIEQSYKQTKKTNFDFYIESEKNKIYFEIKYTENGFRAEKENENHIKKFKTIYKPLLEKNPYINENFKTQENFLKNYQIMRNLVHIDLSSYVVFLIPKQNTKVYKQALIAKEEILNSLGNERFTIASLEDWTNDLINSEDIFLNSYYKKFKDKYFNF